MSAEFIQHRSPQTNKAKAPYNFVPLPEKVLVAEEFTAHDKYDSDRHTGYIELEIKTETPLYTRCAFPTTAWSDERKLENGKPKVTLIEECQEFFHRGQKVGNEYVPVIPGSTLRGMARSLVEILSYSKIFAVSNKKIIHRAVADMTTLGKSYRKQLLNVKAGYLVEENGEYKIRAALEKHGKSFLKIERSKLGRLADNSHKTHSIWIVPEEDKFIAEKISFTDPKNENFIKATLVVTGFMHNKKYEYIIFEPNIEVELIPVSREFRQLFNEDLEISRRKEHKQRVFNKNLLKNINQGEPIFYLENEDTENIEKKLIFFGLAKMIRLPFTSTIHDFLDDDSNKTEVLDLTESIFGKVEGENTLAGRVFFSDAVCKTNDPFFTGIDNGRRVPKILSSPKPSAFQNYLNQPEPNFRSPNWYVINSRTLENLKEEGISAKDIEKIRNLDVKEFKTRTEFYPRLNSIGLDNLNNDFEKIYRATSHEVKSYYNKNETQIRGFKKYWQRKDVEENHWVEDDSFGKVIDNQRQKYLFKNLTTNKEDKQHTKFRPVRKDVMFKSRVYFENLSNIELGALQTVLELPQSKRHQIGMAKPYGLGSIKIKPTLVLQNRQTRYLKLFDENSWVSGKDDNLTQDFKKDFSDKIIQHHKTICSNDSIISLEELPRLKQLYTMLEWENQQSLDKKVYIKIGEQGDRQWKERYVLPFPQHVEENDSGDIEFCIENGGENLTPLNRNDAQQQLERNEDELQLAKNSRDNHYLAEIGKITTFNKNELSEIGKKIIKKKMSKEVAVAFWDKIVEFNSIDQFSGEWFLKLRELADK